MRSVIEQYEREDHELDVESWGHLLMALNGAPRTDRDDYSSRPTPPEPTYVLPTHPTVAEYHTYGDKAMRPKGYVLRSRWLRNLALWHPGDASWKDPAISSCIAPKIVPYHLTNSGGCKYFCFAGFTTHGKLTKTARKAIEATERIIHEAANNTRPTDLDFRRAYTH